MMHKEHSVEFDVFVFLFFHKIMSWLLSLFDVIMLAHASKNLHQREQIQNGRRSSMKRVHAGTVMTSFY